jgi:hypothetical protein
MAQQSRFQRILTGRFEDPEFDEPRLPYPAYQAPEQPAAPQWHQPVAREPMSEGEKSNASIIIAAHFTALAMLATFSPYLNEHEALLLFSFILMYTHGACGTVGVTWVLLMGTGKGLTV